MLAAPAPDRYARVGFTQEADDLLFVEALVQPIFLSLEIRLESSCYSISELRGVGGRHYYAPTPRETQRESNTQKIR